MVNSNIGCGALIYCKTTGRYLFLLRNQKKHAGSWGLVGGGVEENESPADALKREIYEEIGSIDYSKIIPLEKFTSADQGFVYHTFFCTVEKEFCPTLNHEHIGWAWIDSGTWPNMMWYENGDHAKFKDIVDAIFATSDRAEAEAIIEHYNKYWMDIIGTRGFKGKKTKNARSQFNVLFDFEEPELDLEDTSVNIESKSSPSNTIINQNKTEQSSCLLYSFFILFLFITINYL